MVEENTQLRAEVTEFQVGDCFCLAVDSQLPTALFINSRNDARRERKRARASLIRCMSDCAGIQEQIHGS
jgi:hypothetical protein